MRGTRHSEEQVIAILKRADSEVKTAELCRQHGITEATYYRWKAKCGGTDVRDAKKLEQLEEENRKLKHVVADLTLDNLALKDVLSKKTERGNSHEHIRAITPLMICRARRFSCRRALD